MNKDQVKGGAKHAAGKTEEKFGEAVGSDKHKVKGMAKQAEGKTQKEFGDVKEHVKDKHEKPHH
jgi:uncharacterized protein YjbJ (UPF0337 family)